MTTNLHSLYSSYAMQLHGKFAVVIAKLASAAVRIAGKGRLFWWQAVKYAERLALNGMWFLVIGDESYGALAMSAINDLTMAGAPELAHLMGTLATLLAACVKSDRSQAAVSAGFAMTCGIERSMLVEAWSPKASTGGKVLPFRRAA